ncbi:MAG: SNF2-related protein [bacterium]
MISATLETITQEQVKELVPREIWHRGYRYFKQNAVLSLTYDKYTITASVKGTSPYPYQVYIVGTDHEISHIGCTCPYALKWGWVCKHAVAALLAWIEQRDMFFLDSDIQVPSDAYKYQEVLPFNQTSPLTGMLSSWFKLSEHIQAYVETTNEIPELKITLSTNTNKRSAILIVPADETPDMLLSLRSLKDVSFSESIHKIRFSQQKALPQIIADYDEHDRLVLTPGYLVKTEEDNNAFISKGAPEAVVLNNRWLWYNNTYALMEKIPEAFQPYFYNEKPLVYSGSDIIDFFIYALPALEHTRGFVASERIRNTHLLSEPRLKQVVVDDKGDWLYLAPYYKAEDITLTVDEIVSLRNEHGFVKKDNNWIYVPEQIAEYWKEKGDIEGDLVKLSKLQYIKVRAEIGEEAALKEPPFTTEFYNILNRITHITEAPAPYNMKGNLRPYQKIGYDWLYFLYSNKLNGILADEMGLGKTHQTMALLSTIYRNGNSQPSLIVMPTSVLDHWALKLQEYLPWLVINKYYEKGRSIDIDRPYQILLTTYNILLRDIEKLSGIEWEYVILDEAQKIKNYKTKVYKASKLLKAKHKLALTGTPIENRLTELWAIFDFLHPDYLGSLKTFIKEYETPISKYNDTKKIKLLKNIINPFKLRRLKEDVLKELPPKIEDVRYCSLSPHQVFLYKRLVETKGKALITKLSDESKPIDYIHIFALITKLKRLCDHPNLILDNKDGAYTSGKFELFKEIMEEALDSGEKVVVFSHYLEMISIIEQWLKNKKVSFVSLKGSTRKRAEVIKVFQSNPDCRVFVGSLMAGGLGIDLTSASVVIHYDRWWNAAREDQATDRVHRIGQKKSVQVFKLITRGTLEEKIDDIIRKKSFLMNSVVESDEAIVKKLSREELIELLKLPS